MKRRDFLKLGGVGALAIGGFAVPLGEQVSTKSASELEPENFPRPFTAAFQRTKVLKPTGETWDDLGKTLLYTVTAMPGSAQILPGLRTPIHGYNGIFPGPTISIDQGVRARLRVRNALPALNPLSQKSFATSTHLHGSASLPQYDGYANDLTPPGQYKDYLYPNYQDARTLWYHDHAAHQTGPNVYAGLAAQYNLHDEKERAQLPQDEFDVGLVLTDAMFDARGRLAYDDRSHSGLWGDVILVNGVAWPTMKVKRRVYRFRVLVGSIARSYRPALSTGEPLTIVATDGGLLDRPQAVANYRHSTGERYEVLIDFSRYRPGTVVDLLNRSNPNNINYTHTNKIMRFVVTDEPFDGANNTVPATLDTDPQAAKTMALTLADARRTVNLRVQRDDRTNLWLIGDTSWQEVVDSEYKKVVTKAAVEEVQLWEIENKGGGWFHPIHLHLVDFKIVGRNTNGGQPFAWERGPKDVVYVGENETVKLLIRFSLGQGNSGGRYMIHCHNLPHEDHDMMAQFQVGESDPADDPNDPIQAALPVLDQIPADAPEYEPAVAAPGW